MRVQGQIHVTVVIDASSHAIKVHIFRIAVRIEATADLLFDGGGQTEHAASISIVSTVLAQVSGECSVAVIDGAAQEPRAGFLIDGIQRRWVL